MEIEEKYINKDMVLIYLMCKELELDFKPIKALYVYHSNVFWNFIYVLFPAFKISIKKFCNLEKIACELLSKLKNNSDIVSEEAKPYYNSIKYFIKNQYENDSELYTLADVCDYLYFSNNEDAIIVFDDNKYLRNVNTVTINNYSTNIKQINIGKKAFKKTSIYGYMLAKELKKGIDIKQATKTVLTTIRSALNGTDKEVTDSTTNVSK